MPASSCTAFGHMHATPTMCCKVIQTKRLREGVAQLNVMAGDRVTHDIIHHSYHIQLQNHYFGKRTV